MPDFQIALGRLHNGEVSVAIFMSFHHQPLGVGGAVGQGEGDQVQPCGQVVG